MGGNTSLPQVFRCIDALDESTAKQRRELLEPIREIVRMPQNSRVFFTVRPHIEQDFVKCFIKMVKILVCPTGADIKSDLEMKLGRDTNPKAMINELYMG